jgi:hypothetical protein
MRCVRHEARAFKCTNRCSLVLVLLLCSNTLQLLSGFCSYGEGTLVPSACVPGPARSIDGTLMATSLQRASPDGAGGPAPRPPAAAPRARIVPPSGAQGKDFFQLGWCK